MAKIRIFGLDFGRVGKLLSVGDGNDASQPLPPPSEASTCAPEKDPLAEPTIPMAGLEQPGSWIGPYKLLQVLGEGGMGIVYLAEQEHPIRRQVALKIIKPGMDSKQVIARFEAERQALALLDHPNIAHVFDAGTTENGRPYFVMEYVEGLSITEYCDRQKLSVEERLRLFVQVCEGVQHAHQKGIIHRDIKPSNVLIHRQDDEPLPKIIDFGVAKAITKPLTERTLFTAQGQLLGTLDYMSPEQAEMTRHDVDTRSDIYSLGVLLYVLLTGALPFDRETLRQAGLAEILRIVREQDPPRPSLRLTTGGRETGQIAENRKTNHKTLAKMTRGDLDWIVMKTLEKDRRRRYETAHALAEDIQRHLRDEPVSAGRPGLWQRSRKFLRRNRALVTGTAAVFLALAAGIVGMTAFAIETYHAKGEAERARIEEEHARIRAEEALEEVRRRDRIVTAQRLYEEGRYQDALMAIESDATHEKASASTRLLYARLLLAVSRTEEAERELEGLVTEPPEIAGAAHRLLEVLYANQSPAMAEAQRRVSESLLPQTAEAYCRRAMAMTAPTAPQSGVSISRMIDWLSQAANLDPGYYPALKARALVYYGLGDFQAMRQDAEALIAIRPADALGYTLRALDWRRRGLMQEALHDYDQAIRFCGAAAPTLTELHDQRRLTFARMGNYSAALQDAEQCAKLQPSRIDYQFNVFATLVSLGNYSGAAEKYTALVRANPLCRKELVERAWKYVFDSLATGATLEIPQEMLSYPIFSAMQEAIEGYHTLAAKAVRVLPFATTRMSWSPDGKQLAYVRSPQSASEIGTLTGFVPGMFGPGGICVLDVEAGTTRLLVPFGYDPAWSPDGELIAFANKPGLSHLVSEELWLVPSKGGEPRQLTLGGWPQWDADSRSIFFQSRTDGTLCRINVKDPNAKPETVMPCPDGYPVISANGRYVAYQQDREISIRDLSTGTIVNRCPTPAYRGGFLSGWSSDGKELSLADPDTGLWIIDVKQGNARFILGQPADRGVWSPDGSVMSIWVCLPYGAEMWTAPWNPHRPATGSTAPESTWEDHLRSLCQRCKGMAVRCPNDTESYLSRLDSMSEYAYQARKYRDAVLLLTTAADIRTAAGAKSSPSQSERLAECLGLQGVERYRAEDYKGALLALTRAEDMRRNVLHAESHPRDTAFIAMALQRLGRSDEAKAALRRLRHLLATGNQILEEDCICEAEKLLASQNSELRLAWDYLEAGKLDEASQLVEAMKPSKDPNVIEGVEGVLKRLASAYYNRGRSTRHGEVDYAQVMRDYKAAVQADAGHAQALSDLAYLQAACPLSHLRNTDAAIANATRACVLANWKDHRYVAALAAVHAQVGDFASAIQRQKEAISLLPQDQQPTRQANYEARLKAYESNEPYRMGNLRSLSTGELVAWWKLDETEGTIAVDSSGNGHHATIRGNPVWQPASGAIGGAIALDGNGDYLEVARAPEFNMGENLTISAWIKVTAFTKEFQDVVAKGDYAWRIQRNRAENALHFGCTGPRFPQYNLFSNLPGTKAIIPGRWYHVAAVYDGNRMYLYVDGDLDASQEASGSIRANDDPVFIGGNSGDLGRLWFGAIDDVRIYNYTLSVQEIKDLKNASEGHNTAGPEDTSDRGGQVLAPAKGIENLQKLTLALWVKLEELSPRRIQPFLTLHPDKAVLRYDGTSGSRQLDFYIRMNGGMESHIRMDAPLDVGVFHHIAGTYDGKTMRLFFDGVQRDRREATGLPVLGNGVEMGSVSQPFWGELDEVQIYDRALDAREIRELYTNERAAISAGEKGPVAWWNLDEGSGVTARDSIGSNNGLVRGATWTAGKFGGALRFGPQKITVASDSSRRGGKTGEAFKLADSAERTSPPPDLGAQVIAPANGIGDLQKFTLALWVKLNAMPPGSIQRFLTLMGEKAVLRYDGDLGSRQLHFYMKMSDGSLGRIRAPGRLSVGAFHHVVGTYDGERMRLFYDGVEVGKCETTSRSIRGGCVELGSPTAILYGDLDDVQIYDRALDANEIQELHASDGVGIPVGISQPIAWWRLDDMLGVTARDCVGSNDGVVHGATWTTGKFGGALHFAPPEIRGLSDPNVGGDKPTETRRAIDSQQAAPTRSVVHARVNAPGDGIDDLQKFSMVLWVKLDALPPDRVQRFITLQGEKAVLRYDGANGARQLDFYMTMTDGTRSHSHIGGVFDTTAYHHVAGTYDGHAMRLYFDGVEMDGCETTGLSIRGKGVGLGSGREPLYGELDEVQIYDRALDTGEIQELYSKGDAALPVGMVKPVTWWNFDEMSGTIARDWVGSNNATLQGATWTSGKFGGALHFAPPEIRGLSDPNLGGDKLTETRRAIDSQQAAPPRSDAGACVGAPGNGIDDLQKFSMTLWVKLDALPADRIQRFITLQGTKAVLRHDGPNGARQLHFYMMMTDGNMPAIRINDILDTGAYHHVAGTFDGHTMRLFFDGVEVGTRETTGLSIRGQGVGLGSPDEFLCGELDEVQIYDRALDAGEIQELYSKGDAALPVGMVKPVTWWNFDEMSGTIARDRVGSNNAILQGAAWTPGKFGGALHFDPQEVTDLSDPNMRRDETTGAGQVPDSQNAAPSRSSAGACVGAPGKGIDDLQKFSMALWVKLDALPADRIQRFITLQGEKAVLRYEGAGGRRQLVFYMKTTHGDEWPSIRTDSVFDMKAYHHVAGTYDGHTMRLFFDGAQVAMCETTGLSIRGGGVGLGSSDEPLYGELDEVQIYDRALDAGEIQELYSKGDAALPIGMVKPVTWWNCDEMSGTIARDRVGSNNAILQGAAWTPGKFGGALHFDRAEDAQPVARETFDEGRGLVAHWKLDSDTQDSVRTNHGILHGNPVWTAGRIGGALQFDGTGDYVDCGNNPLFDIAHELTVAGWIKVTTFDTPVQAVITKGDSSWRLQRTGGQATMSFHCNLQAEQLLLADGTKPVNDGGWHHVAGVFDGSSAYLFVDGVPDVATPPTPGSLATNAFSVWIGDNSEAPGNDWRGLIDDVRVYNRALSAKEIAILAGQ